MNRRSVNAAEVRVVILPSPRGGEGSGVRGKLLQALTPHPNPSPPRGEGLSKPAARWVLAGALLAGLLGQAVRAQEKPPAYPHVNAAAAFAVDPQWPARSLPWSDMSGIAVDGHDHIWTFTRAVPPVQVYDTAGKLVRAWGDNKLKGAHHVKIDPEGNVWLAVYSSHIVQKYTPEGKLLLTLGTPNHPGKDETHFNRPTDMAITPAGDIFVSDGYGNARIVHFDKHGKFVKTWGELGSKPGQFSIPHAIVVDSRGRLYVADRNNVRIQVFDQNGKLLEVWNNLLVPWGMAITKNDEIWACGSSPTQWRKEDSTLGVPPKDQVFMKFNTQGKLLQLWTVPKGMDGLEKPGECNWVHCISVDSKGNLYVGDIKGKRAQKFVRLEP